MRLVAGLHRLEAAKRLGYATIPCTVLHWNEPLRSELAEIDENIIRNNPGPAEHAILTERRCEITKELDAKHGAVSQFATPPKQALRGAGIKTGHDVASVRDQAKRTGESKDKIQRSKKRSSILGNLLHKIRGTCLDNGQEMDALLKMPVPEREALVIRAASGEDVSARTPDRMPSPPKRKLSVEEKALAAFDKWATQYEDLEALEEVQDEILAIDQALIAVIESRRLKAIEGYQPSPPNAG